MQLMASSMWPSPRALPYLPSACPEAGGALALIAGQARVGERSLPALLLRISVPLRLERSNKVPAAAADRKNKSTLYLEGYAHSQQRNYALWPARFVRERHLHVHGGTPLRRHRPQRRR